MNCNICNKPVVLVPSARERAAKSRDGMTAADYTKLFPRHAACELAQREDQTAELCRRKTVEFNLWWKDHAPFLPPHHA